MGKCTAISKRSNITCKNWAIRGKTKCRFHGGKSTGPKTKNGKERVLKAHIKHGLRTKDTISKNKETRKLIKLSKNLIKIII